LPFARAAPSDSAKSDFREDGCAAADWRSADCTIAYRLLCGAPSRTVQNAEEIGATLRDLFVSRFSRDAFAKRFDEVERLQAA
jgi:hypothetical protein